MPKKYDTTIYNWVRSPKKVQGHGCRLVKIVNDDVRTGVGFGVGTYGRHGGISIGTGGHVSTYDEALLVIDLIDRRGDLLWRGKGTCYLPAHTNPEKTEKMYNERVEKILGQFPPEGK